MQSPLVTAGTAHSKNTEIMDQVNKPMDDEETENESEEQELLWPRRNKIAGASVLNNGIVVADKETKGNDLQKNTRDSAGTLTVHGRAQFDPESAHLDDIPLSQVRKVLLGSHSDQFSPEDRSKEILEISKATSTLTSTFPPKKVSLFELESTDLAEAPQTISHGAQKSQETLKGIVLFHNKPINMTNDYSQKENSDESILSTTGIRKPQSTVVHADSSVTHAVLDTPRNDNSNGDSSISMIIDSSESTGNQSTVSLQDEKGTNESSRSTESNGHVSLQDFKGTSSIDSDSPMTDRNESMKRNLKDACTSSNDSDKEPAVARCSEYPKPAKETTINRDHFSSCETGENAQSEKADENNDFMCESPDPFEEFALAIDSKIIEKGEPSGDGSIQPQEASGNHPGECSDNRPQVSELAGLHDARLAQDGGFVAHLPPAKKTDETFAPPRDSAPPGMICDSVRELHAPSSELTSQSNARTAVSATSKASAAVANASVPEDNRQGRFRESAKERDADRNRRKTKDGCLLPRAAPKKRKDGTFARPSGRIPRGMVWDEVRGLYAPTRKSAGDKAILSKKGSEDACSESDESASEQDSCSESDESECEHEEEEDSMVSETSKDEKIENICKPRKSREADLHNRMTEDGSFLPHPTYQAVLKKDDDGLYLRPPGRCPTGTFWDPRRGLHVRKQGEELSATGKRNKVSSSTNGDRANKRQKKNADKDNASHAAAAPRSYPSSSDEIISIAQLESTDVKKRRHSNTKTGTRVYAEWPNPKGWFFATVMDIKRKPNSHFDQYSLLFDDGDFLEFVSIGKFILEEEYRAAGYAKPFAPMPRAHAKKLEKILKPANAIVTATEKMNVVSRSTLTLEQLLKEACGECSHCQKPDCGLCFSCLTNQTQVCIQKMCCKISVKRKAQPMPPSSKFPEGWRYVIDPTIPNFDNNKAETVIRLGVRGLKLFPPTGIYSYYSVEAAKSYPNYKKALADVSPEVFYQHVGGLFSGSPRRETASPLSLPQAALSIHRVKGSRVYCSTNDMWGIIEKKLRLGNGSFRYSVRFENDNTFLHSLDDQDLLTEVGYVRKTGRDPPPSIELEYSTSIDTNSCKFDGTDVVVTTENLLVGRKLCFAWLDVNGRRKEVRGSVVACEFITETEEVISCLVAYNQKSRALANSTTRGSLVPEYHWLEPPLVVGGCMFYEEQLSKPNDKLSELTNPFVHSNWINPDLRHESTVNGFPVLKLAHRGYLLEFRVGESSIKGAGKGVFLSCTSLEEDNSGDFELDAGDFLDLGVYEGDFRPDGRKTHAAFLVKNFIHSSKCEDYAFDPREHGYQLDITDDITGDLHALAKNSLLPFVNEGNDNQVCIHPMHDPENVVHYLLGNLLESGRKFVLPCDGREIEVFTDYGKGYEKVRVRRGYSSLPEGEERNALEEEIENDDFTDIETISSFCAAEVQNAVNFMFNLFVVGEESQFSDPVMIDRALVCSVFLQQRAKNLFLEEDDVVGALNSSPVNLLQTFQTSRAVVISILKLFKGDSHRDLQRLQAVGDAKGLWKAILERQTFSDEQLEILERQITEV